MQRSSGRQRRSCCTLKKSMKWRRTFWCPSTLSSGASSAPEEDNSPWLQAIFYIVWNFVMKTTSHHASSPDWLLTGGFFLLHLPNRFMILILYCTYQMHLSCPSISQKQATNSPSLVCWIKEKKWGNKWAPVDSDDMRQVLLFTCTHAVCPGQGRWSFPRVSTDLVFDSMLSQRYISHSFGLLQSPNISWVRGLNPLHPVSFGSLLSTFLLKTFSFLIWLFYTPESIWSDVV